MKHYPECLSDDPFTCPYFKKGFCTIDGGPKGQCDDYDYANGYYEDEEDEE